MEESIALLDQMGRPAALRETKRSETKRNETKRNATRRLLVSFPGGSLSQACLGKS